MKRDVRVLKLDDLHVIPKSVISAFCRLYDLNCEENMFDSTFQRKRWWGDKLTKSYRGDFNKEIHKEAWNGKLFF